MTRLICEALWQLMVAGRVMRKGGFAGLKRGLEGKLPSIPTSRSISQEELSHAMDVACSLYIKTVLCLQRSAATAFLFRAHGFPAELVVGVQLVPFQSHAWLEVDGRVVNDRPYIRDIYSVLDRC